MKDLSDYLLLVKTFEMRHLWRLCGWYTGNIFLLAGNNVDCLYHNNPVWHYWRFCWAEMNTHKLLGIKGHQLLAPADNWHPVLNYYESWYYIYYKSLGEKRTNTTGDICCFWITAVQNYEHKSTIKPTINAKQGIISCTTQHRGNYLRLCQCNNSAYTYWQRGWVGAMWQQT